MKKKWFRSNLLCEDGTSKFLKVMKIAGILLLTVFLQISGATFSQNKIISIKVDNVSLPELFKVIQKQSDFDFFFTPETVPAEKRVSLNEKDSDINDVLKVALEDTNLDYKIVDTDIVIFEIDENNPNKGTIQQQKTAVAGTVTDGGGEPLPGVNVFDKADPSKGVITDYDGNFSIELGSANSVLVFSYIGFQTEEIIINEPSNNLNVILKSDFADIDEIVVTALGIKREKKVLGYAMQEVKGDDLTKSGSPIVTSALEGKVAGVQFSNSGNGLGGSTKVTIRGNNSLTGTNEPLWIVDGVPFDDSSSEGASMWGGYDRGGSAMDINPDDIETISVLKGANASALYGSRASNGVIIVTTKKGTKKDGFGVNYSFNQTISKVSETLELQRKYGQGVKGTYYPTASQAFGPEFDGSTVTDWKGEEVPFVSAGNPIKDYFKTGVSRNHNVSLGNTSEKGHYRISLGSSDSDGLFEGESLDRKNFDVKTGFKTNKFLEFDNKISLSQTKAKGRPAFGKGGEMYQLLFVPSNVAMKDLEQFSDEDNLHRNWHGPTPTISNPYYVRYKNNNEDIRSRAFGYLNTKVNINENLFFNAKYALDYHHTKVEEKNPGDPLTSNDPTTVENDGYRVEEKTYWESNTEFMTRFNKTYNKLDVGVMAGANFMHRKLDATQASIGNLVEKGFYYLGNSTKENSDTDQYGSERKVHSVYGSLQLTYNHYLTLDATWRKDWSSALPKPYDYPSVSTSFIVSDFLKENGVALPKQFNFIKFRGSVAQVGKDFDPYSLVNYNNWGHNGNAVIAPGGDTNKNPNLKAELSTSYEAGLDVKMFNNRLGIDATLYWVDTKNQIMAVESTASFGWKYHVVNGGLIQNKGLELMFYGTPVRTENYQLDLDLNFSNNTTYVKEITELSNGIYNFKKDADFTVNVVAREGSKLGDIYAQNTYARNENGDILVTDKGLPLKSSQSTKIGNIQPDFTGSFKIGQRYKNISLNTLFTFQQGGNIVSVSEAYATQAGTAKRTLNRDNLVFNGVKADGTPNDKEITAQSFYQHIGGENFVGEEFVYDASYIQFKELSLSYRFGEKVLGKLPISDLSVSLIARDLFYLKKNTPGTAPNGGFNRGIYSQAIDFVSIPSTRTTGFSVKLSF